MLALEGTGKKSIYLESNTEKRRKISVSSPDFCELTEAETGYLLEKAVLL